MALSRLARNFVASLSPQSASAYPLLRTIQDRLLRARHVSDAVADANRAKPLLFALFRQIHSQPIARALSVKIANILLAHYHLRARNRTVASSPYGLVVDPSNTCQLACPGCVHSEPSERSNRFEWKNSTLPQDLFSRLLVAFGPTAIGVYFCNYGEPLLNRNTPGMIRESKRYLASAMLSTSLSVKKFDAEAYVQSGLDFMVISVDGASQDVYSRFRRNGNLETVLHNMRALVEAKRKLHAHYPVLSWNFLAFEHNQHEIPAAMELARMTGIDQFRVVEPFDVSWDDPSIVPAKCNGSVHHLRWIARLQRPGNWNPFPTELQQEAFDQAFETPFPEPEEPCESPSFGHACHWLYKNTVMDSTGRILPCCGAPSVGANLNFGQFPGLAAAAGSEEGPAPLVSIRLEATAGLMTPSFSPAVPASTRFSSFNTSRYTLARQSFRRPQADEAEDLYCSRCEWDQETVNIGDAHIRDYFRSVDPAHFDPRSLALLCSQNR
ncbi:MAG: hypothetical protein KIT83_22600 [Bryobacterales bacterium]|nr:hypothetical protein [Bryobacterales bacterium]